LNKTNTENIFYQTEQNLDSTEPELKLILKFAFSLQVDSPENKISTNVKIVNAVSARSLETKVCT
jgi:hypothetical protein